MQLQESFALIDEPAQAAAALHPLRSRLLEQFRQPRSAAEAARCLDMPRQRVGHHVRLLRRQGLLVRAGQRRRGAFTEQLLQTRARAWAISPRALGALGVPTEQVRDRFSSEYLALASARTLRDLGALRALADEQHKRLATLTVETEVRFAGPAEQAAFADALTEAIAQLVAQFNDESAAGGRRFRFMIGGHPVAPASAEGESDDASSTTH